MTKQEPTHVAERTLCALPHAEKNPAGAIRAGLFVEAEKKRDPKSKT